MEPDLTNITRISPSHTRLLSTRAFFSLHLAKISQRHLSQYLEQHPTTRFSYLQPHFFALDSSRELFSWQKIQSHTRCLLSFSKHCQIFSSASRHSVASLPSVTLCTFCNVLPVFFIVSSDSLDNPRDLNLFDSLMGTLKDSEALLLLEKCFRISRNPLLHDVNGKSSRHTNHMRNATQKLARKQAEIFSPRPQRHRLFCHSNFVFVISQCFVDNSTLLHNLWSELITLSKTKAFVSRRCHKRSDRFHLVTDSSLPAHFVLLPP